MVKWKKLNKKVAGVLLGVMVLFPYPQQPLHMWIRRQRRQIQKRHRRRRCRAKKQKSRQMRGFCRKIIQQRRRKMLLQNREMGKSRMISRMDPVKNSLRSQQRITIPFIL